MSFIPENYDSGKTVMLPMSNGGSSATYSVGQALAISSGYYATAAAGQNTDVTHVCMEAGTVTTNGTMLKAIRVKGVVFVADCDADPVRATEVGTFCDLASATQLDTDASTDDLFYIEDIVGAATDRKVRGWFVGGVPNS